MGKERLIVIGGDAAGMSAASKVRREDPEREIIVFERGPHTSYSACGLPYYIAGMIKDSGDLVARTPEKFKEKYKIDARIGHEVLNIDPDAGKVRVVERESGREFDEAYDQLLIATGGVPICPDLPGSGAQAIFGLSTLQSGIRVRQFVDQESPRRAVVVGGGYIGLEMAEALVRRGLEVSLVERSEQVMATLDPDMGSLVSDALREVGVTLYLEESLTGFEVEDGRVKAVVTDKRTLPADMVILGMGVQPNSTLAENAGLELGEKKAIKVDSRMRTSKAGIWAAGDCVESYHLLMQRPVHIALGTVANKQGTVVGINLAGGDATFPGVVGTAVSKICKYEVARTGLREADLKEMNIPYVEAVIKSRTRAGYYPGSGRITVKLMAHKEDGRLLGGQIVGLEGAAKRIDVLATAITTGLTAQQLVDLDLSYAPPFSPVWDPVQTAARQILNKL